MKNKTLPERCPLCGGTKKEGKTTFTADLGFGVVVKKVIRNKYGVPRLGGFADLINW